MQGTPEIIIFISERDNVSRYSLASLVERFQFHVFSQRKRVEEGLRMDIHHRPLYGEHRAK